LTVEEEADLEASLAEAERGEFATDEEMRAIWAKYGRRGFATHAAPPGNSTRFSPERSPEGAQHVMDRLEAAI
jgi:hypothetical protein